MGSIFSTVGASILVALMRKEREEKYLKQQGTPLKTKFKSVEIDTTNSCTNLARAFSYLLTFTCYH